MSLAATAAGGCTEDITVLAGSAATSGTTTGSGGSSGTGSTSSGSTTGSGGDGTAGGHAECASLALAGQPILAIAPNVGEQTAPALALSRDDATRASLVFAHTPYLDNHPPEVAFVSFLPWGDWSSVVGGPSAHAIVSAPPAFAVSQTPGDSFNLLSAPGDAFEPGAWFVPHVVPAQTPPAAVLLSDTATRAVFAVSSGSRHLLGFEPAEGGVVAIPATSTAAGAVDLGPTVVLSCSIDHAVPSAAVPSGTGWLAGVESVPGSDCVGLKPPPGPPPSVNVLRIAADGTVTTGASMPPDGPVAQIALAARSDGAWLVWQHASDGKISPIRVARLDLAGYPVLGPLDLVPSESEPGRFGVARIGDDFVIAYEALGLDAEVPSLVVARVGSDGVVSMSASLDGPILTAPPSVLTSPGGDRILVGYGVLGDHPEVAVARFDCTRAP